MRETDFNNALNIKFPPSKHVSITSDKDSWIRIASCPSNGWPVMAEFFAQFSYVNNYPHPVKFTLGLVASLYGGVYVHDSHFVRIDQGLENGPISKLRVVKDGNTFYIDIYSKATKTVTTLHYGLVFKCNDITLLNAAVVEDNPSGEVEEFDLIASTTNNTMIINDLTTGGGEEKPS